jgi:hypothetical protein
MPNKDLFGVTAQPVTIYSEPVTSYVICKYDLEKLTYWNRDKREWVGSLFDATLWPRDEKGKTPYLSNNVYSLLTGFTAKGYTVIDSGAFNLHPCFIKYGNLYLEKMEWIENHIVTKFLRTIWTNHYSDAYKFYGQQEVLDGMWQLIYGDKQ